MENIINVTIRDKIAKNFREREPEYICGNSDFIVEFDFDEEWDEFYGKTARFVYNDTYQDVVFTGNQCEIPAIENTHMIKVGVFAGNLKTTTPAIIMAKKSILCGSGVPAAPADDVYMQILKMLSACVEGSEGATFTPIATEVEDGVELSWENDKEMPNPEPVKIFNGADGKDGKDGKDGYTPVKGVDYFDGKDGSNGQPGSDGRDGVDGITPHIGQNGNWYIGETDTGKPSQGNPGKDGSDGNNGVSVSHVWEGTVLKVTSASGTSSADLKGEKGNPGDAGKDGYTPVKGVDYSDGAPGKDGKDGVDGRTPVKGVDYFDGKDGQDGSPGKDGKDGTSVTVKSVTESTADGGNNVVTFSDGKTLTVKNGSKGSNGETGAPGKSAYQYAAEAGFTGTAKEFSEKLAAVGSSGGQDRTHFELAPDGPVTSGVATWINYNALKGTDEVTAIYDGISFLCPVTFRESFPDGPDGLDESFFYLGNYNGSAPEYPFFIWGYRVSDVSMLGVGEGQHTISVIKKIDKKYLPDELFQEVGGDVDILPEETVTLDEYAGWGRTISKRMTVGNKYIITIDGVEYERVAMYDEGFECPYIGNIALLGNTDHENANDDIFYFAVFNDGGIFFQMVTPDYENKTVTVAVREVAENSGSSGGVPSWNDLPDKPFDSVIETPVFDGDMTGRDTVFADASTGAYAVKITDQVVSVYELVGATLKLDMGGTEQSIVLTDAMVMDASLVLGVSGAVVLQGTDPIVLSLPEDGVIQGAYFRAGTWFMCIPGAFHVKSVSCLYPSENVTKKVAAKFIDAEWMAAPTEGVIASRYTTFKYNSGTWNNINSEEEVIIPDSAISFGSYYDFYIGEVKYSTKCIDPSIQNPDVAELGVVALFMDEATMSNQAGFYAFMATNGVLWMYCSKETSGRLLVRIVSKGIIVPMPEKYMPILTSPSGKKFRITVDDNGTISATEVT